MNHLDRDSIFGLRSRRLQQAATCARSASGHYATNSRIKNIRLSMYPPRDRLTCAVPMVYAVYNLYIMRRTQTYLTEEQGRLLEARSKATGRTISALIRAAIDSAYRRNRGLSQADRVRLARRTAGSWKNFPETGAEYVDRVRGARRLAR